MSEPMVTSVAGTMETVTDNVAPLLSGLRAGDSPGRAAAGRKGLLTINQILGTNDYLVADNDLFFAIMQSDGNFCVYRGSGPGDNHGLLWNAGVAAAGGQFFAILQTDGNFCIYKGTGLGDNRGHVWGSQMTAPGGQFFAGLQNDGNFCVYKGTSPADNRGHVWGTQVTDPVVDFEISRIDYNLDAARIPQSGPAELYHETVINKSDTTQTSSISGSKAVSETSGWSDSLSVKVGVSTSFKTGIPFVAEGKVKVSLEVTNTYTWNGSTTTTKTWGFNVPVNAPPKRSIEVLVSATISDIEVPYTLTGNFILRSGARLGGKISGTYNGTNSHDLTVTFKEKDPVTSAVLSSTTRALEAAFVETAAG